MKKLLLSVIVILMVFQAIDAQKIQFKKGILSIDAKPFVQIEGKINVLKADLTFKALDGSELFTFVRNDYFCALPQFDDIGWYEINFTKSGKTALIDQTEIYNSEKDVYQLLFVDYGLIIKDNEIDPVSLDAFMTENDQSERIKNDLAKTQEFEGILAKVLTENQIDRDKTKELVFKQIESDGSKMTLNEIWQGDVLLGTFRTVWVEQSFGSTVLIEYTIEKIIKEPFEFDGVTYNKAIVAFADIGLTRQLRSCVTFQDKQEHMISFVNGGEGDLKTICVYLISKGYL